MASLRHTPTPLAHCICPLTDPVDFEWGRSRDALWIHPFRWIRRLRQEVEHFSTFQAATYPSYNQVAYARALLTDASEKTTPPSVSHGVRHPLTVQWARGVSGSILLVSHESVGS